MVYKLFDYVDAHGKNVIKAWTESLQVPQRAKLNEMLDKLAMHGDTLHPLMMAGSGVAGVSKLKVKGNVQLRPLLCKGPIDVEDEYTLLNGAKEVGGELKPQNAREIAKQNRDIVKRDPEHRRKSHERVG